MALTLPQLVYNIRNIIKDRSDDIKISDRQLEFIINYYRAKLIKQEVDKKRSISSNIIQDLGKVELTKVDSTGLANISNGKYVLRTTLKIPKLIELTQQDAIIYVGGLDKTSSIDFVSKAQSKWNKHSKYGSKNPTAYYRDGYIYIVECPKLLKYINIEGIFEDPREVAKYNNSTSPCYDITNDPYPLSAYMIPTITELILSKEIAVFMQAIEDEINDASTKPRNSNLQK